MMSAVCFAQQHPVAYLTKAEAKEVAASIRKYPLLTRSYNEIKADVDAWVGKDVDVPFPKDPAGGYTHDKHKNNYVLMFNSGVLYNLTGDAKYAKLVKEMLLKYAKLNPTLQNHPEATSSSPGRIFWQALNDANWLVYTGLAFDAVHDYLTPAERKIIADGAFKPEVDFFTKDLESWFNLIHNHGVWACAGVGIVGIATDNEAYLQMALKGTHKDGKGGFLAQLDNLFSPDGYYTEGPYYVRYAILPYYIFANALQNAKPSLNIFQHRDKILLKALNSGLQLTNIDGSFLPLNDALKDKTYISNELVVAVDIAWRHYGDNAAWLPVAKKQNRVILTKGGAGVAKALATAKNIPTHFPYTSVEYRDGAKGDEGGVTVLRTGKGDSLTTLAFKYPSHGLSHGHYDKLNINLFDNGNEILTDYGSVRFISVEQKYGGRYLPENKSFAAQSIAHNTISIDEKTMYGGKEEIAEKYHGTKLFDGNSKSSQVISAMDDHAYEGHTLMRSLYMVKLPGYQKPFIVDLFRAAGNGTHTYDLPFHYQGNIISTNFKYTPFTKSLQTAGDKSGYQFLWREAEATPAKGLATMTFLNGRSFYSIATLADDSTKVLFTRSGANDPNFNVRREPGYIIRKKGNGQIFVNVIEIHGEYNPISEINTNSYSSVKSIQLLRNDEAYTIAEIDVAGKKLLVGQSNQNFTSQVMHNVTINGKTFNWTGPYFITYNNNPL
jgi:oligo-alginate lyase